MYGVTVSMRTAFLNGLLNGNANDRSQVSGSCSTNNCTWPTYTSLAFCPSDVEDVTSTVRYNCGTVRTAGSGNVTTAFLEAHNVSGLQWNEGNVALFSVSNFSRDDGSIEFDFSTANTELKLVDIVVLYRPFETNIDGDSLKECESTHFNALQVSISLCLQSFETSVVNGSTRTAIHQSRLSLPWHGAPVTGEAEYYTNPLSASFLLSNATGTVNLNRNEPIWTQVEDDPQRYATDVRALIYLSDALRYQVFTGAIDTAGAINNDAQNNDEIPDGMNAVSLALFGPQLSDSSNLNSSMTRFQLLLDNVTSSMTNA